MGRNSGLWKEFMTEEAGGEEQVVGFQMPDARCQMPDAGCQMPIVVHFLG